MAAMMIATERIWNDSPFREVFADVIDLSELLDQYEREQLEATSDESDEVGSGWGGSGLADGDREGEAQSGEEKGEGEGQHPMPRPVDVPIGCWVSVK